MKNGLILLISFFILLRATSELGATTYIYDFNDLEKTYTTKIVDPTNRSYGYDASKQWVSFGETLLVSEITLELWGSVDNYPSYYDNEGNKYYDDMHIHQFYGVNFNSDPPPAWSGTWSLGSWGNHSYSDEYTESIGSINQNGDFYRLVSVDYAALGGPYCFSFQENEVGVYLDFYFDYDLPAGHTTANEGIYNVSEVKLSINATPVPEPSTMLLVATGLIGLAGFRKKFKN